MSGPPSLNVRRYASCADELALVSQERADVVHWHEHVRELPAESALAHLNRPPVGRLRPDELAGPSGAR